MMKAKVNIDKEKWSKVGLWLIKSWPILMVGIVTIMFMVLTYFALYPRLDPVYIEEGKAKVKALDIRFDTKLLQELGATNQPSELKASGGRDPFTGY